MNIYIESLNPFEKGDCQTVKNKNKLLIIFYSIGIIIIILSI